MKKSVIALTATAAMTACQVANATLTFNSAVGGAPSSLAGIQYVNFDNLASGAQGSLTATGPNGSVNVNVNPNAKVAQGSKSGEYAAPWLSPYNGDGFGPNGTTQPSGQDTTPYLTSGTYTDTSFGSIEFQFGVATKYFGLLWGSIDDYNTLSFFDINGILIDSLTGSDVTSNPNGDQGVNGTRYVNIFSSVPFYSVKATSSKFAFELDNVAFAPVPEPSTVFAGVLLLLPFGASAVRILRKKQ